MAVTLLIEGARADHLQFAASPLAELGSLLHLIADPGHHVPFRDLAARLSAALPASLATELDNLSPLWTGYRIRLLYPVRPGSGRSFADELRDLTSLDEGRVFEAIAWGLRGGHSGAPSAADLRTAAGRREVLDRARARGARAHALAESHFTDPGVTRRRLVELLAAAHTVLDEQWRQVAGPLSVEVQVRQSIAGQHGIAAALTGLTPVARMLTDPARVVFDKLHRGFIDLRRASLLALPSVHNWPHVLVKHEHGWPALIQYPIGSALAHHDDVSPEMLRRRLVTLSDPTRLRVCRLIAREPLSTSEIGQRTGMSAPQISRMLRPLREHGLIQRSRNGHFVLYRLNLEMVTRLGADLVAALLR
jgi:DNA-binding transcriptional ArsR family regulator